MPLFDFEQYLDTFWVLDSGSGVEGCIGLEAHGASALLRSIVVAPSARGTGAGHRLTVRCLEEARARGVRTAYLFTMDKAPFFSRYGFEICTLDDFDSDARLTTQFVAVNGAPHVASIVTAMRLGL